MVVGEIDPTDVSILNSTLNLTGDSSTVLGFLVSEVGKLGLWLKAIGLLFVLWLVFEIAFLVSARMRRKKLAHIEKRLDEIDKKLDSLAKKLDKLTKKYV